MSVALGSGWHARRDGNGDVVLERKTSPLDKEATRSKLMELGPTSDFIVRGDERITDTFVVPSATWGAV